MNFKNNKISELKFKKYIELSLPQMKKIINLSWNNNTAIKWLKEN